jgi:hypothetical protein
LQSQLPQNSRSKKSSIAGALLGLVLIGASIFVWLNFQSIIDQINYYAYNPPASIAAIAKDARLTDEGKFAFYTAQPVIDGTRAFNVKCDRKELNTAILGCYAANRIFIFDITDERLEGIQEVTAVHEMLHVVYQRMSDADRTKIDALLEAEAKKLEDKKEFAERMAFYARTEPGERYNELHSIIGTEVDSIDSNLEKHYERYFDRQTILELYKNYKNEFKKLEKKAIDIKKQIDDLTEKIDNAKDKYASSIKQLDRDIADFNERAESGNFDTQAQFDSERQTLINRTNALKGERVRINKMVDKYNTLIKQHNDIITESNSLYKSIDSSLAPAPSV